MTESQNFIENLNGKKIFASSFRPMWKNHYLMEVALLNFLGKKNFLEFHYCRNILDSCEALNFASMEICAECSKYQIDVIKALKDTGINIKLEPMLGDKLSSYFCTYNEHKFSSIHELKQIKYDNFEIGNAILNFLVPNYGIRLDFSDRIVAKLIRRHYYNLIEIYNYYKNFFGNNKFDYVLIFNGRFPHENALLSAAIFNNLNYIIHERGSSPEYISIYKNFLPHYAWNIANNAKNTKFDNFSNDELFYIKNIFAKKPYKNWVDTDNFTSNQIKNYLPLKSNKKIISIFLSTEEEFVFVPNAPVEKPFFDRLEIFIKKFYEYRLNKEYDLIIRDHPNAKKFSQEDFYSSYFSKFSEVTYFSPTSTADTYKIIESSYSVITFGSTVGFEALTYGIRVISLTKYFAVYATDLPGIFVYDVTNDIFENVINFLNSNIDKKQIIESSHKIAAAIHNHDIKITTWISSENNKIGWSPKHL